MTTTKNAQAKRRQNALPKEAVHLARTQAQEKKPQKALGRRRRPQDAPQDQRQSQRRCEDASNPCIKELMKLDNVEYISTTLENDLKILGSAQNLVIGFGTFGFLLYLMNPQLRHLYLPKYFADALPRGSWGQDIEVTIVELPGYIRVGEWKNTPEQRKLMLEYQSKI